MNWRIDDWESKALSLTVARVDANAGMNGIDKAVDESWDAGADIIYLETTEPLDTSIPGAVFVGEIVTFGCQVLPEPSWTEPIRSVQQIPDDVGSFDLGGRYERDPQLRKLADSVFVRWISTAYGDPNREVHTVDDCRGLLVVAYGGCLRIELIGVHRHRRGRGMGRQLLQLARQRARDVGSPRLVVGGYTHNSAAMCLYGNSGLSVIGRHWRYHLHRSSQNSHSMWTNRART